MYKVLLVEDEEIIRKGLMFAVDWLKAGCVVVGEAMDGEEGLDAMMLFLCSDASEFATGTDFVLDDGQTL